MSSDTRWWMALSSQSTGRVTCILRTKSWLVSFVNMLCDLATTLACWIRRVVICLASVPGRPVQSRPCRRQDGRHALHSLIRSGSATA